MKIKTLSIEQLRDSVLMCYVAAFANKALHKTLSARCSFRIIARPKRLVLVSAAYCRSGRGCACECRR